MSRRLILREEDKFSCISSEEKREEVREERRWQREYGETGEAGGMAFPSRVSPLFFSLMCSFFSLSLIFLL
jgi:hypothetical protein